MKRGMLGSTVVDTENYWTEGRDGHTLRRSETILYAEIDLLQELAAMYGSRGLPDEVQECYNRMDMFYLMLRSADLYAQDRDALERAGIVIGNMADAGYFSGVYPSLEDENKAVALYLEEMQDRVAGGREMSRNGSLEKYFTENVINYNYYKNPDGTITTDAPRLSGLGATSSTDEYSRSVKEDCPLYFLYAAADKVPVGVNKQGASNKYILSRKVTGQNNVAQFMENSPTNLTAASVRANAYAGIVARMQKTPEECIVDFANEANGKSVDGLGVVDGGLSFAIVMCVSMLMTLIEKMFLETSSEEAAANNQAAIEAEIALAATKTSDELAKMGINVYANLNRGEGTDYAGYDVNGDGFVQHSEKELGDTVRSPFLWLALGGSIAALAWSWYKFRRNKSPRHGAQNNRDKERHQPYRPKPI